MTVEEMRDRVTKVWGEGLSLQVLNCIVNEMRSRVRRYITVRDLNRKCTFEEADEELLMALFRLTAPNVHCLEYNMRRVYDDDTFEDMDNVEELISRWAENKPFRDPRSGEMRDDWSSVIIYFSVTEELNQAIEALSQGDGR